MLGNVDTIFDPAQKPKEVSLDDFETAKQQATDVANNALEWVNSGNARAPSGVQRNKTCTIEFYDAYVGSIGCGGAARADCIPGHTERRSKCVYH